ncbi:MAG: lipopolysaccharide heptosyltransferase I [Burkholderiaceae bacterium]
MSAGQGPEPPQRAGPRIALVKTSSMGDVIHALPVVTDILRAHPGARIHWVVEEAFADLPALHPGVADVHRIALRRWRRQWRVPATRAEMRAVRTRLRTLELDWVLDLQGLIKSAWMARWLRGTRAGFSWRCAREPLAALTYDRRIDVDMSHHAIERLRELAATALGYRAEGLPSFGLRAAEPSPALRAVLDADARPYRVFLHATSRAEKQWPAEHWVAMMREAVTAGLRVLLPYGSDAERDAAQSLVGRAGAGEVLPRLGLADCAALLAGAHGVVGVDTGLTHLAAALDRPTVALFAATPAWRFGPYWSERARGLGEDGVWPTADQVSAVLAALESS